MSIWAYKVITSGKGGFATPALLETFLNQLGTDGWEIIHFQTQPDNSLAFTGLARRSTQRDWTLEDAAATAARAEVDKLRAEFEAKFKGSAATASEEKAEDSAGEKAGADDGLRRLRDTERDLDRDAPDEGGEPDEWEALAKEDELPTFFEAIQPLMRRNQRGSGLSIGVDHLAKKWNLSEEEVVGALKECGFTIPEDEDTRPAYIEYDGDLYWVNVNRRGELWINTKEKSRPVFRAVPGAPVADTVKSAGGESTEPPAPAESRSAAREPRAPALEAPPLPAGPALLEKIRPLMRRSRRGRGGAGSLTFLSRALKCSDAQLLEGFAALGLTLPDSAEGKPVIVEISGEEWWLDKDQRSGVWINGQEAEKGEKPKAEGGNGEAKPENEAGAEARGYVQPETVNSDSVLAAVRLLLKPTKTGSLSGETGRLAETLGKSREDFLAGLSKAGLKIPERPREKPVFLEAGSEIFWLNKNSKDELWLNSKASKFAAARDEDGAEEAKADGKSRRIRSKTPPADGSSP